MNAVLQLKPILNLRVEESITLPDEFRVDASGKRSAEEMKTFDPHAEEVVFVPMPVAVGG